MVHMGENFLRNFSTYLTLNLSLILILVLDFLDSLPNQPELIQLGSTIVCSGQMTHHRFDHLPTSQQYF